MRRPLLEQLLRALLRDQRRIFRQVRLGREAEAAGSAVLLRRGIDALEVLALVGRHSCLREAADLGVRGEQPCEQRRSPAAVQAGKEGFELVPLHGGQS